MSTNEKAICPICEKKSKFLWQSFDGSYDFVHDHFEPTKINKWACVDCVHLFASDVVPEYMKNLYDAQDRGTHVVMGADSRLSNGYYKDALDFLKKTVNKISKDKKSISILEIGCGSGEILVSLKHEFPNALVHGIDINTAAKDAEKFADVEIKIGQYPETSFENQKYDLVILQAVFEHQIDPGKFFRQITQNINEDTEIFIAIPYSFSILLDRPDLKDKKIHDVMNNEHLQHFSIKSIALLVQKYGFDILQKQVISKGIWNEIQIIIKKSKNEVHLENYNEDKNLLNNAHYSYICSLKNLKIKLESIFSKNDIAVYGVGWHTSVVLPQLYNSLKKQKMVLFDNDQHKQNVILLNHKIHPPNESEMKSLKIFILSTMENVEEMKEFLIKQKNIPSSNLIDIYA